MLWNVTLAQAKDPSIEIVCYKSGYKGLLLGDSVTVTEQMRAQAADLQMHGGSPMVSIGSRYLIGLAHRKWWSPTMQNPQYEGNDTSHASSYGMWVGYLCELLLNAIALRRAHGPTRTVTQHKHYCRLDLS